MKVKIDENSKQILLGSLLGDGTLSYSSKTKKSAYYRETHSSKQEGYLIWKNMICFTHFVSRLIKYKQFEKTQQKYYEKIRVSTRSSDLFLDLRELFYPNGIKVVSREILNQLNELGIAVWYCDDGNYHFLKKNVRILTDSFSYNEQKLIQEWFKEEWNLNCKITRRKTGSYYIEFNVKESAKFLYLIKDYIPPSMRYKLGHLWEENKERIEKALRRESISKQKYYLKNKRRILSRQNTYRKKPEIKERESLTKQVYYRKNKERILNRCREYAKRNKQKMSKQRKIYYSKNIDKIKTRRKRYYSENREKVLIKQIAYNKRPEIKQRKRIYDRERYRKQG
ncbi:MAG: hypothetical protein ABIH52_03420 [Candidatus Aenigmatarchaeota archaeon]